MMLKLQGYQFDIEYLPWSEIFADTLSRLLSTQNNNPVELDVRVDFVCFSTERVERIREASRQDNILHRLAEIIITGWPENIKHVPKPIRPYWPYRDELSVENGIILKGGRILIPES